MLSLPVKSFFGFGGIRDGTAEAATDGCAAAGAGGCVEAEGEGLIKGAAGGLADCPAGGPGVGAVGEEIDCANPSWHVITSIRAIYIVSQAAFKPVSFVLIYSSFANRVKADYFR